MDQSRADTCEELQQLFKTVEREWQNGAHGWAPPEVSELLTSSRLDRLEQLAGCLRIWINPEELDEGTLILAWTNLGALIEGFLQLFLTLHYESYEASKINRVVKASVPTEMMFKNLIDFFDAEVWSTNQKVKWSDWLHVVRRNRNSIHSFQNRELGDRNQFLQSVDIFRDMALDLAMQFPPSPEYYE